MSRRVASLLAVLALLAPALGASEGSETEAKIRALLARMSLGEKIGQMCLGGRGSRGSLRGAAPRAPAQKIRSTPRGNRP